MLSGLDVDGVMIEDEEEFQDFLENNHDYWDYVDEEPPLAVHMEHGLDGEHGPEQRRRRADPAAPLQVVQMWSRSATRCSSATGTAGRTPSLWRRRSAGRRRSTGTKCPSPPPEWAAWRRRTPPR